MNALRQSTTYQPLVCTCGPDCRTSIVVGPLAPGGRPVRYCEFCYASITGKLPELEARRKKDAEQACALLRNGV